jgi:hypothetical protein
MSLLMREMFDNGDLSPWAVGLGWSLVDSECGKALQVQNSNDVMTLLYGDFFNAAVQARFLMHNGPTTMSAPAQIALRFSTTGNYLATLNPSGEVNLLRNSNVLQTVFVAPSTGTEQWRTLRLSTVDGMLRVAVDDQEVMVYEDSAPLPPGKVKISTAFISPGPTLPLPQDANLLMDDFLLWVPTSEIGNYPLPTPQPTPTLTLIPMICPH